MSAGHFSGAGNRPQLFAGMDSAAMATLAGAALTQNPTFFFRTFSLTSAAAATAVNIISEAEVGTGRKVMPLVAYAKVNGATDWATTANVKLQDTNGSAVDFATWLVAALTGNAEVGLHTAGVGEAALLLGTAGTAGKGLQIKGDANGTGSTLTGFVFGLIF